MDNVDVTSLIPSKSSDKICSDVATVLRRSLRPLAAPPLPGSEDVITEEHEMIEKCENDLLDERIRRMARPEARNEYGLTTECEDAVGGCGVNVLSRKYLLPSLGQDAAGTEAMWVRNVLADSCELSRVAVRPLRPPRAPPGPASWTEQSMSIGWHKTVVNTVKDVQQPPPRAPEVVAEPAEIVFMNFNVGEVMTRTLRLINQSKAEVRLSLSLPKHKEFLITVNSSRGLRLSGLAAMELTIDFKSKDCLSFTDELVVNLSTGCKVRVPLICFIEPPILHISVLDPGSSSLSLTQDLQGSNFALDLGTRLFGDMHCIHIHIYSSVAHVSFFVLSEDDWLNYTLENVTKSQACKDGAFTVFPVAWRGGGAVDGLVRFLAPHPGLHEATFRITSTMSVVRELNVVADSLMFSPKHIFVEGDEKDYDVNSVEDVSCGYYLNLGVNVAGHSLAGAVTLVNRSPITYSYSWLLRPWGEQHRDMFIAKESSDSDSDSKFVSTRTILSEGSDRGDLEDSNTHEVFLNVMHTSGIIQGESQSVVRISVPDVGQEPGVHRMTMVLTLQDVPKESIHLKHYHMIMNCKTVEANSMCGPEPRVHEVCTVEVGQLEVWWRVERLHFTLDPFYLVLQYSRRLKETILEVHATQTNAGDGASVHWLTPGLPTLTFVPGKSELVKLPLVLPASNDERIYTDVFRLVTTDGRNVTSLTVKHQTFKRHLELNEHFVWKGFLPPKTIVKHDLCITNNTYLYVPWRVSVSQWLGLHGGTQCAVPACGCMLIDPVTGALEHAKSDDLRFSAQLSETEGLVIWLAAVKEDPNQRLSAPGCAGRGAALACRVLAARVLVAATAGRDGQEYPPCPVEANLNFIVRPTRELVRSKKVYCILIITNTTPIAGDLHWEDMPDDNDYVNIEFIPKTFHLDAYGKIEIKVLMEGRQICPRKILVRRLFGDHAHDSFLLFDVGVSGIKVTYDIELEEGPFLLTRTETEEEIEFLCLSCSETCDMCECEGEYDLKNPHWTFYYEDEMRRSIQDDICFCKKRKIYIPPAKKELPRGHKKEIEIVTTPPLTEVCPCTRKVKPILPDVHPICLQFRQMPLNTEVQRWIILTNVSSLETSFEITIRKFPWKEKNNVRRLVEKVQAPVTPPGLALWARPAAGALAPGARVSVAVCARASTWGLYSDQVLIQVNGVEPLVLDLWVEAVGLPLRFPSQPRASGDDYTLQMTTVDASRTLLCNNESCASLLVLAYIFKSYGEEDDSEERKLPFQLALRFFDVPRRKCACYAESSVKSVGRFSLTYDLGETDSQSTETVVTTGIELCLLPNCGSMVDPCYQIDPQAMTLEAGATASWKVSLLEADDKVPAAPSVLWFRVMPIETNGYGWFRPDLSLRFQLRHLVKTPGLQLLKRCIIVRCSAYSLPCDDVLRIRKSFQVSNPGDGPLTCWLSTGQPWSLVTTRPRPFGTQYLPELTRQRELTLKLEAGSSEMVCVEVEIETNAVWPKKLNTYEIPQYEKYKTFVKHLDFSDKDGVIMSMPLILELEYPVLCIEPAIFDFGTVTHGDWRKTYYTIKHSSPTATITLQVSMAGDASYRVSPSRVRVPPRRAVRVYVLFHAIWEANKLCATAVLQAEASCARWCAAAAGVRAAHTRDYEFHLPVHDYTDDAQLLPDMEKEEF